MFCRGVRPFGVSLLIAGWDEDRPYLFQSDPSVQQININQNIFITVYCFHHIILTCNLSIVISHREHTSPGKPQQWERTMWMEKRSLKKGTKIVNAPSYAGWTVVVYRFFVRFKNILQSFYSMALYHFVTDIMKIWSLKMLYTPPS